MADEKDKKPGKGLYGPVVIEEEEAPIRVDESKEPEDAKPGKAKAEPKEEPRGFSADFKQGLTTNDEPRGAGGLIGRAVLPTTAGAIGSFFGAGVPGAAAGSAAGESVRQAIVSAYGGGKPRTIGDVVNPVIVEGALGAAGEKGAELVGRGVKALSESAGPQLVRLLTKVPEKYALPAIRGELKGAPSIAEAGAAYEAALAPLGLKSLDAALPEATGRAVPGMGDFKNVVEGAAQALNEGTLTPQQAIWGRQAIVKLEEQAKLGNPEFQGVAAQLGDLKKAFDAHLSQALPDLAPAQKGYFLAKGADAFKSWVPRNKNGTPDTLRALMGVNEGAAALFLGHPGALAIPAAQSPRIVKGVIDVSREAAPFVKKGLARGASPLKNALDAKKAEPAPTY